MTNNFILSLIFSLVIFLGVYKDDSNENMQVATIIVEQNIVHLTGKVQNANAWSLFKSLKDVNVHMVHQTENGRHQCLSGGCIHQTANGFAIKYCCVKRLLSIIYSVFFLLLLYKFSDFSPRACKNDGIFKGFSNLVSTDSSLQ